MITELLAACGSFVWVYILNIPALHRWFNRKPFACEVCMAGWFDLCLNAGNTWWMEVPFRMAAAMCITILLTNTLKKV
jgi:hypothetical protein